MIEASTSYVLKVLAFLFVGGKFMKCIWRVEFCKCSPQIKGRMMFSLKVLFM